MREEGYYWVKLNQWKQFEVALWLDKGWYFPGFMTHVKVLGDGSEVDENQIKRDSKELNKANCMKATQDETTP